MSGRASRRPLHGQPATEWLSRSFETVEVSCFSAVPPFHFYLMWSCIVSTEVQKSVDLVSIWGCKVLLKLSAFSGQGRPGAFSGARAGALMASRGSKFSGVWRLQVFQRRVGWDVRSIGTLCLPSWLFKLVQGGRCFQPLYHEDLMLGLPTD